MNTKDIKEVLLEFVDSNDKSLLIDGPWGCGKTHQIRNFLKEQKDNNGPKCYYVSLFGIESIKELNNELYVTVHKTKAITQRIINGAFKIASAGIRNFPIPGADSISDVVDGIGYALGEIDTNKEIKTKRCPIIIFDDMERVGDKITYEELLGYISNLYLRGIRFVGVTASDKMASDKKGKFDDFKEKVFDGYYVINEANREIIKNIFLECGLSYIETAINLVGDNIRRAQKSASFYKKIEQRIKNTTYNSFKNYSKENVLEACIIATTICFEKRNYELSKKDSNGVAAILVASYYEHAVDAFGESIAKTYMYFKENDFHDSFNLLGNLIDALMMAFLYRNFTEVDRILFPKKPTLLDQIFFLLSDKGKKEYLRAVKTIVNQEFVYTNELRDPILTYFDKPNHITNKEIDFISKSFQSDAAFDDFISFSRMKEGVENPKLYLENIGSIIAKKKEVRIKEILKYFRNKDYKTMNDYLYSTKISGNGNNEKFIKYLIENDFFLPNLCGDITLDEWGYAHEVADYAKHNNIFSEFSTCLDRLAAKNKTSKSLGKRISILREKAKIDK